MASRTSARSRPGRCCGPSRPLGGQARGSEGHTSRFKYVAGGESASARRSPRLSAFPFRASVCVYVLCPAHGIALLTSASGPPTSLTQRPRLRSRRPSGETLFRPHGGVASRGARGRRAVTRASVSRLGLRRHRARPERCWREHGLRVPFRVGGCFPLWLIYPAGE